MAHILILGITRSGKTTLGKELAASLYDSHYVIVCNPKLESGWRSHKQFQNGPEMARYLKRICQEGYGLDAPIFAIWEEARQSIGPHPTEETIWCFTQGAGYGLRNVISNQKLEYVSTECRSQCDTGYIFRISPTDAKKIAEEFSEPQVLEAPKLDKYVFLHVEPFELCQKKKLKK